MAALNTLRTKGSILLTAVIGISLLAFLLGDGTSLFNNTNTSVGTINGKEVSLKEYATEVELMTTIRQFMTGASSLTTEETEGVQNQVWSKFVSDAVLLPSYKGLGLEVSDVELLDMVNGV
ncbi:MAG: SurA N-terminal domain-containing protein, partial [Rikenellaceae bacterium]